MEAQTELKEGLSKRQYSGAWNEIAYLFSKKKKMRVRVCVFVSVCTEGKLSKTQIPSETEVFNVLLCKTVIL